MDKNTQAALDDLKRRIEALQTKRESLMKKEKEQNFVSAMPVVFSVIEDCETIGDVESRIDEIKNAKGVADAWSDGHQLYVAIAEDEVYSFHFSHDAKMDTEAVPDMYM